MAFTSPLNNDSHAIQTLISKTFTSNKQNIPIKCPLVRNFPISVRDNLFKGSHSPRVVLENCQTLLARLLKPQAVLRWPSISSRNVRSQEMMTSSKYDHLASQTARLGAGGSGVWSMEYLWRIYLVASR